jgi:putative secretion ATPase (PEP-CTERM system associated)
MYERFHRLRERPFSLSPDPDYLYPSRVHKEALSYLRYGIEGRAGFIVITGEIGSGKTTLLQTALRGLDRQTSVARLVNTMLDARDLIEAIVIDFGMDPGQGRSKPQLLRDLARYLVDQRAAGRLALLMIDEAQNLSPAALEEVRMLSNLETEKSKLIQIALIGQPSLRDLLARPELEQLRQRVTVSYHLQALDAAETAAYINHRLRRAAIGAPLEFPPDVTRLIYEHSQGVPRKINVIADAVLLFAYGEDQHDITVPLTREVLAELEGTRVITPVDQAWQTGRTGQTPPAPTPAAGAPPPGAQTFAAPPASSQHSTFSPPFAPTATAAPLPDLSLRRPGEPADDAPRPQVPPGDLPLRSSIPRAVTTATPASRSTTAGSPLASGPSPYVNPAAARPPFAPPAGAAVRRTQAAPVRPLTAAPRAAAAVTPAAFRQEEAAGFWARVRRSLFAKPAFEE